MTIMNRRQKAITEALSQRVGWARDFGQQLLGYGMVRMSDDDLADDYLQDKKARVKDVEDRLGVEEAGRYRMAMEELLAERGYIEDPQRALPEPVAPPSVPPQQSVPAPPPAPVGPPPTTNGAMY